MIGSLISESGLGLTFWWHQYRKMYRCFKLEWYLCRQPVSSNLSRIRTNKKTPISLALFSTVSLTLTFELSTILLSHIIILKHGIGGEVCVCVIVLVILNRLSK